MLIERCFGEDSEDAIDSAIFNMAVVGPQIERIVGQNDFEGREIKQARRIILQDPTHHGPQETLAGKRLIHHIDTGKSRVSGDGTYG